MEHAQRRGGRRTQTDPELPRGQVKTLQETLRKSHLPIKGFRNNEKEPTLKFKSNYARKNFEETLKILPRK